MMRVPAWTSLALLPLVGAAAHTMATSNQLPIYLDTPASPMPPPPAPRLDDWELKVVDAWIANPLP